MNDCGDGFGGPTENEYGHELSLKQEPPLPQDKEDARTSVMQKWW